MQYWLNFATVGDPNGPDLPGCQAYDSNADQMMELGDVVGMCSLEKTTIYNLLMQGIDRQLDAVEQVLKQSPLLSCNGLLALSIKLPVCW